MVSISRLNVNVLVGSIIQESFKITAELPNKSKSSMKLYIRNHFTLSLIMCLDISMIIRVRTNCKITFLCFGRGCNPA